MNGSESMDEELDDRLLDCLLEEVEGHGPAPDLERRTLDTLAGREVLRGPGSAHRRSWGLVGVAVLALAVVTVVAWWQGGAAGGDGAVAAPGQQEPTQEPDRRSPEELITALAAADQHDAAARALLAAGPRALPALVAALGDKKGPRGPVLEVLEAMERPAAPALTAIADLILAAPTNDEVLGPAFRAAATLAPFGAPDARMDVRRAMLITAFAKGGPAVGGGQAAVGGPAERRLYSLREVGRLLHRLRVVPETDEPELIGLLRDDSPYVREFAARLLADHPGEATVTALRAALADGRHPTEVVVQWALPEGYSGDFTFTQQHDDAIRLAAARSLVRVAGDEPRSGFAHAWLLEHGDLTERRAAATTLARSDLLEDDRPAVIPALLRALASPDPQVVRESVTAIGIALPSGTEPPGAVVVELTRLAGHDDAQIAARAMATLRALQR